MLVCATVLNEWIDETDWMPRLHTHEAVEGFYRDVVFKERNVWVANSKPEAFGFAAIDREEPFISALYVNNEGRGKGLGSALLDKAKKVAGENLELWTFTANEPARKFYNKHGFLEIRRTEGDNEEGLPDILLRWEREHDSE